MNYARTWSIYGLHEIVETGCNELCPYIVKKIEALRVETGCT